MPRSVPHQKWIRIHKPKVTDHFLQISHSEWMNANKTLTPFGLQLYLYLASNNNNYEFALSPADAEERAELPFHKMLLNDELPLTIGGGIGQSRLCMLMMQTAHIGEVQASIWDDETISVCEQAGIRLL